MDSGQIRKGPGISERLAYPLFAVTVCWQPAESGRRQQCGQEAAHKGARDGITRKLCSFWENEGGSEKHMRSEIDDVDWERGYN
jgi:hypothetical protein